MAKRNSNPAATANQNDTGNAVESSETTPSENPTAEQVDGAVEATETQEAAQDTPAADENAIADAREGAEDAELGKDATGDEAPNEAAPNEAAEAPAVETCKVQCDRRLNRLLNVLHLGDRSKLEALGVAVNKVAMGLDLSNAQPVEFVGRERLSERTVNVRGLCNDVERLDPKKDLALIAHLVSFLRGRGITLS